MDLNDPTPHRHHATVRNLDTGTEWVGLDTAAQLAETKNQPSIPMESVLIGDVIELAAKAEAP